MAVSGGLVGCRSVKGWPREEFPPLQDAIFLTLLCPMGARNPSKSARNCPKYIPYGPWWCQQARQRPDRVPNGGGQGAQWEPKVHQRAPTGTKTQPKTPPEAPQGGPQWRPKGALRQGCQNKADKNPPKCELDALFAILWIARCSRPGAGCASEG